MVIRENYSHAKADKQKRLKRDEAVERQKLRDKRTNKEQLLLIKGRRGNSAKEIARLTRK